MPVYITAYADLGDFFARNPDVTHQAFARRVGSSQPHISRIVRGENCPRPALAIRIARAAKVPIESFAWARVRYVRRQGRR